MIVVYAADVKTLEDDILFEDIYSRVSVYRKRKTDKMHFRKDKNLSLGVEFLFMEACKAFGLNYEDIEIKDVDTKPRIADCDVCFNLSHSHDRAMCIMANHEVGCDVEKMRDFNMLVAKNHFHEEEYSKLMESENKEELFYRYWTLKESFMKCTGLGFRLPLDDFCIDIDDVGVNVRYHDDHDYCFFEKDLHDGYRYAWCIKDMKEVDDEVFEYRTIESI